MMSIDDKSDDETVLVDERGREFKPELSFPCPSCCALCHMGTEPEPYLLHETPGCNFFIHTEPSAFVDAVVSRGQN